MSRAEIEQLIARYEKYPEAADYVKTLRDHLEGKSSEKFLNSLKEKYSSNNLIEKSLRLDIPNITNRHELYQLDFEQRQEVIIKMAIDHHFNEIKAGHVQNDQRTKDYRFHPIVDINAYLLNVEPLPYDRHEIDGNNALTKKDLYYRRKREQM
jgi:hypothetical protein